MDVKKHYALQGSFLIAIFIIGNTLIYFPKQSDIKSGILGVLIAAAISVIIYLAFALLNKKAAGLENIKFKPLCFIIITITCFLISLVSSSDYISYVNIFRMPYTLRAVISIIFIALSFYLAIQKDSVLFKISLLAFIYVFLSVTILFIISLPQLDFKLSLPLEFKMADTIKSTLIILSQSFLSALPLVLVIRKNKLRKTFAIWLVALFLGLFVLMVCMLNVLLIFGPDLSSRLELPYMSAMSVINSGKIFSRLEGFSYLNYFICSLIKTATPLYVIKNTFEKLFNKSGKLLVLIVCTLLVLLSFIYGLTDFLYSVFFSGFLLLFEILFILTLGFVSKKRINKLD